jgi:hypothetical protein
MDVSGADEAWGEVEASITEDMSNARDRTIILRIILFPFFT